MQKLRVSVVIPTLDSNMIDQTLKALENQAFDLTQVEVIVVGQDKYRKIQQNSLIRFVETDGPVSAAKARNIGIEHSQGEIICFTDDDCIPDSGWLSALISLYENQEVMVVGGAMVFPVDGYWAKTDAISSAYEQLCFQPGGPRKQLPSLNFSARRAVLEAVGGFSEKFQRAAGEDTHLAVRLRQAGYELLFEPGALVHHVGWRRTMKDVLAHAHLFGRFTVWIHPDLQAFLGTPFFMRHWLPMLFATPFLAIWITSRMYTRNVSMLPYWHLYPSITTTQISWCLGVMRSLKGTN